MPSKSALVHAVDAHLVHAVDAHEARATIGCRRFTHADARRLVAARLGQHHALLAVAGAVAKVVQVPHRDRAQGSEARVAKDVALAARARAVAGPDSVPMARSTSASSATTAAVSAVQRHARALGSSSPAVCLHPTRHQPRHLCAAVAAQALQVGQHRPSVRMPQLAVAQPPQHRLDPP
jgi:hypothetical protein